MRWLLLPAALAALPAHAEIRTPDDCAAAVASNPAAAREEAAIWTRLGGGIPARLCEAEALAATGAHASAAEMLTTLATDPNRAMTAALRAGILADAARQLLTAGQPDLARAALAQADKATPADADRQLLAARAAAATGDWPAARATLDTLLAADPSNALAHALLAATLRQQDDPAAALAEARRASALAPDLPEALFETGAALAETGDTAGASQAWLALIDRHPDSDLAPLARANLQRLN